MVELAEAYRRAEAFKDVWAFHQVPYHDPLRVEIRKKVTATFPRSATKEQIEDATLAAIDGLRWVAGMARMYDLDPVALLGIAEDIEGNCMGNLASIPVEQRSLAMGVGAGLFTGILTGLMMKDDTEQEPKR